MFCISLQVLWQIKLAAEGVKRCKGRKEAADGAWTSTFACYDVTSMQEHASEQGRIEFDSRLQDHWPQEVFLADTCRLPPTSSCTSPVEAFRFTWPSAPLASSCLLNVYRASRGTTCAHLLLN